MAEQLLMCASAGIVGAMGLGHLLLTYWGPKLLPRDPAVREAMAGTTLVISSRVDVWRAWLGFNASHSLGAMLFGVVYGYLALVHADVLFRSAYLQATGLALLGSYVLLARRYWFATPLLGSATAFACFLASIGLGWLA